MIHFKGNPDEVKAIEKHYSCMHENIAEIVRTDKKEVYFQRCIDCGTIIWSKHGQNVTSSIAEVWQVPPIVLQICMADRQAKRLQMAILDTFTCKNCGFAMDVDLQSGLVPMGYRWCIIQWHKNMGPFRHVSTLDGIHGWVRTNTLSCPFFVFEPDGKIGR